MPSAVFARRFRESSARICRHTTRMAVLRTARIADSEVHILRHAKSACQAGEQVKVRIRVPPQAGFGVRLEYSGTPVSSFRLCNVNRLNLIQLYIADVMACSLVDPCRQFKYRNRRGFEWSRSRAFTQSHHGGCSVRFKRCCATQCGLCESTGHRLPQSWRRLPCWGSSFVVVIQRASPQGDLKCQTLSLKTFRPQSAVAHSSLQAPSRLQPHRCHPLRLKTSPRRRSSFRRPVNAFCCRAN